MPSLNDLPVELVVKVLRGAPLQDILNVTRTTVFLRAVGFSSRSLWMNAQDADRLPLPMGETLENVSLSSIGKLAAYAIALLAVWSNPLAHPIRVSHIGPCPSLPRSPLNLTSPHGTILPGNQWLLIDMDTDSPHVYFPASGEFLPLGVEGSVISYAYESPNNGSSIVIAILNDKRRGLTQYERFITVYTLQFDPKQHCRSVPCVRLVQSIRIPAGKFPSNIDLKGSLIVASADQDLFIFNWQEGSGVHLSFTPQQEQNHDIIISLKAYFHPTLPIVMAEKHALFGHSIDVVNVPTELVPFEGHDLENKVLKWPKESFNSTCIHPLEPKNVTHYRGFHRNGKESAVLDIVYNGVPSQELFYLSLSGIEGPALKTSCHTVDQKKQLFDLRTAAGRTICVGRRKSYKEGSPHGLAFMRMPGGCHEEPRWVGLEIPEDVTLRGVTSEVLAFDDVYGTLLLDDAVGNYCIVQY